MADGGDGDGFGGFIHTIDDQVGEARHGEAAQSSTDMSPRLRVIEKQPQSRSKLILNVLQGLRVAGCKVGGDAVEVGLGPRGKA